MNHSFSELGLPVALLRSLEAAGFSTPTPIQQKAIPPQLEGRDIMGIAQTGSGKTAAFCLPILTGLAGLAGRPAPLTTRALILAPTRELAVQIDEVLRTLGDRRLSTVLVLGGTSRSAQVNKIARGVDVVVATPGRLKDLVDDRKLRLAETRWLVLDEADRMLDMGFIGAVKAIAQAIGPRRQTAMFSATMSDEIARLASGLLNAPVRVETAAPATTVPAIAQRVILAHTKAKRQALNTLLDDPALERVIIFSRTKHGADRVAKNLAIDGHEAAAIHGNKSQNARQAALKAFASGKARILVATDIAARGIDVPNITHVINYELPDDAENYVHRIGRTGRNGASGIAITLCNGEERAKLREVERLIRRTLPVSGDLAAPAENSAPTRAP
ncbi:MAG: DEAD/DEAH box helicase, partial [Devosia sp.]